MSAIKAFAPAGTVPMPSVRKETFPKPHQLNADVDMVEALRNLARVITVSMTWARKETFPRYFQVHTGLGEAWSQIAPLFLEL